MISVDFNAISVDFNGLLREFNGFHVIVTSLKMRFDLDVQIFENEVRSLKMLLQMCLILM